MATTYYTPGVYIEEVDKGTKPIQGVSTSVTAFIGFTAKAEKVQDNGITTRSIIGEPTLVTNWGQYEKMFGSYHKDAFLPHAVRGFLDNGGTRCYVVSVRAMEDHRAQGLVYGRDDKTGKELAVLLLRAANGGMAGDELEVQIKALEDGDGTQLSDKERKQKRYALVVGNGKTTAASAAGEPATQKSRAEAQKAVDKQKELADQLAKDVSKLQKEMNKEHSADDLAKIKQELDDNNKKLAEAKAQLESMQKELDALQSAPAQKPSADGGSATSHASGFEFTLDSLPFWGEERAERQRWEQWRKDSSRADKSAPVGSFVDQMQGGTPVEVWKLYKQGREASILPTADVSCRLQGGTWQFDYKMLELAGVTDEMAPVTAETDQASIVVDNSQLLYRGGETARKGIEGLFAFDDINLVCAPDLMKVYDILGKDRREEADGIVKSVQEEILTFCKRAHYPFAILDAPPGKDVQGIAEWRMAMPGGDTMHGALYYPWIKVADPFDAKRQVLIPPSGHVAGIYARSDNQRGVHKAPANEIVSGAIDLQLNVTKNEQELLNPIGVNCIRAFPGRGIRIWGARTLAMTDPSWRYINVRRLFSYVEASVERSTQWVVFEPNDHMLWAKVRRDVSAFLRTVWLSGALFGLTPEEAFYVKCDEETNLPELRDLGQMVCEIGMAPVKPAEFVIFRFSQWTSEADLAI